MYIIYVIYKCNQLISFTAETKRGYLSWEWHKAIRGYSHPLIFAIVYKTLALCNLDYPNVMVSNITLANHVHISYVCRQ